MRRHHLWISFILVALLPHLGGCRTTTDDVDTDSAAVAQALVAVVTGLEGHDGPLACSHMLRDAQEALMASTQTRDCISAVARVQPDAELVGQAKSVAVEDVHLKDGEAEVRGDAATAVAKLLNLPGVWLTFFEGSWMLSATPNPNPGGATE